MFQGGTWSEGLVGFLSPDRRSKEADSSLMISAGLGHAAWAAIGHSRMRFTAVGASLSAAHESATRMKKENHLKFSAVFGQMSLNNSILMRPAATPPIVTSKKTAQTRANKAQ